MAQNMANAVDCWCGVVCCFFRLFSLQLEASSWRSGVGSSGVSKGADAARKRAGDWTSRTRLRVLVSYRCGWMLEEWTAKLDGQSFSLGSLTAAESQ